LLCSIKPPGDRNGEASTLLAVGESLGIELRRPPSDFSFRYFFHQVDVAALCAAISVWTIAQIPSGTADLDQLFCDGKTLRFDRAHRRCSMMIGWRAQADLLLLRLSPIHFLRRAYVTERAS